MKKELKKEEIKEIENKVIENQKKNNKILGIIIVLVVLVIAIFGGFALNKDVESSFDYKGVYFEIVNEIAPYRTTIEVSQLDPITGAATKIPFYYYIRNDPRELDKKIPFEGELTLMKNMVLASDEGFNCGGMGNLGVTNMARFYESIGVSIVRDETAECDPEGRYLYMRLVEGNETKIVEIGNECYIMYIHDCEILEATERFMVEGIVETNKFINR